MTRRFQFSLKGMLRILALLVFCVLVVAQFIGMGGIAWIVAAEFWLVASIWGVTIIKSQGGPGLQFSLRALLVLMLVVAAFFSGATWQRGQYQEERASWRARERGLNERARDMQHELDWERHANKVKTMTPDELFGSSYPMASPSTRH